MKTHTDVEHAPRAKPCTHSEASHFVRDWPRRLNVKPTQNLWLNTGRPQYIGGHRQYAYEYPGEGYTVRVAITPCVNYRDRVIVGATNWRCEHEPSGVITRDEARELARQLLQRGFVLTERHWQALPGMLDSLNDVQWRVHFATDDAKKGSPSYAPPERQTEPPRPFTPLWVVAAEEADREYPPRDWCGLV